MERQDEKVLKKAVEHLVKVAFLAQDVLHPLDYNRMVDCFEALRDDGVSWKEEYLQDLLEQVPVPRLKVKAVLKIAKKVALGKRIRREGNWKKGAGFDPKLIENWRGDDSTD